MTTETKNPATGRKILSLKGRKKIIPATKATKATKPPAPVPTAPKVEGPSRKEIKLIRQAKLKEARNWLRNFDVIKNNLPLVVGIHKQILKARPENMAGRPVREAVAAHVKQKAYRALVDGNESTCQRFNLDGTPSNQIMLKESKSSAAGQLSI